ncbi:hypothetical protein ACLPJK_26225 [Pseudomonas aeruginosa]|uniref:hypothetical protein n=1 Tax=Pseudomonas aeruginosa TaxID=287 RepID=UPI003D2A9888
MDIAIRTLDERAKGQFPLSIATSLSFESLLGIYPERENQRVTFTNAQAIYVNLQTLYRNIVGSIPTELRHHVHPVDFATAMANELDVIRTLSIEKSNGSVEIVPYFFSYNAINRRYPYAIHWNPRTNGQRAQVDNEASVFKEFVSGYRSSDIFMGDMDFDNDARAVYVLTHHPVDLMNRYRFGRLTLLESHTGTLKPPGLWHTKLTGLKDITVLPFDRMTLQVFGDGVMFRSMPPKLKKTLVELGNKYNWTVTSTKDLIISGVKRERDPVLEGFVLKLY